MRRSSMLMPISVLAAGFVVIALLIFGDGGTRAAPIQDITDYPPPQQTELAIQALTAASQTDPYPVTTQTARTQQTAGTGATTGSTAVAQATPSVGATTPGTSVAGSVTATVVTPVTPLPVSTATASSEPTTTATPTPDLNNLACTPGATVQISGSGPPNAGFLLFFNKRIVSGGTVQRDGTFTISLEVGNERAGSYAVEVRVRGTQQLLATRTCNVPETTPTPIPRRIR